MMNSRMKMSTWVVNWVSWRSKSRKCMLVPSVLSMVMKIR